MCRKWQPTSVSLLLEGTDREAEGAGALLPMPRSMAWSFASGGGDPWENFKLGFFVRFLF